MATKVSDKTENQSKSKSTTKSTTAKASTATKTSAATSKKSTETSAKKVSSTSKTAVATVATKSTKVVASESKSTKSPAAKSSTVVEKSTAAKTETSKTVAKPSSTSTAKAPAKSATKTVSTKSVAKSQKQSAPVVYDEDSIQHLEGLEHIRLRPGMYIGSLGDGSNENDGIYILLKEGIDNSIDEFNQGFGKRIDIEINEGRVKIRDYGRGIPLGKLDDCVSNVNTGAKYNSNVFQKSIGMNGVGIKATNALSSYFRAASIRDGKMAVVEYKKGEKAAEPKLGNAKPGAPNGTYLEFEPDAELFGKYQFNMEYVEKRLWNYAYLNPGLLIKCNGKDYISEKGIEDLLMNEMGKDTKPIYKLFNHQGETIQFVITHVNALDKCVFSFVNGQSTEDGGTHVTSFLDGFTKGVNSFFKKNYDEKDVTSGLLCALKIGIDEPMFTSQTKNKLGNVEIRGPIINAVQTAVDDWLRHNPDVAGALEDKIIKNHKKEIQKKKDELDLLIANNAKQDDIYIKSVEVDIAIAIYLKATRQYDEENKRLIGKYEKLLEKNYKEEIINMIKKDVIEKVGTVPKEELEHFCNNVYILCSLKAHKIDEQEIVKQVMYRNNIYLHEMQQKGKVVDSNISKVELKFYTKLKNKYVKIIKERI